MMKYSSTLSVIINSSATMKHQHKMKIFILNYILSIYKFTEGNPQFDSRFGTSQMDEVSHTSINVNVSAISEMYRRKEKFLKTQSKAMEAQIKPFKEHREKWVKVPLITNRSKSRGTHSSEYVNNIMSQGVYQPYKLDLYQWNDWKYFNRQCARNQRLCCTSILENIKKEVHGYACQKSINNHYMYPILMCKMLC